MKKEDLTAMGLTEEQAKAVMGSLDGDFVTKARFNEVNAENKALRQSVAERDGQLEALKKAGGDQEALKKQIEALQQQNAAQQKAYEGQLAQLRLDGALDAALTAAGARNSRAAKALLDMGRVRLEADGTLTGLEEQLKALKKSDGYLFAAPGAGEKPGGFWPGASGDAKPEPAPDLDGMTYSQMTAYLAGHPDTKL